VESIFLNKIVHAGTQSAGDVVPQISVECYYLWSSSCQMFAIETSEERLLFSQR
jgi:hypothetical protein